MLEYEMFAREELTADQMRQKKYDIFISAFNDSDRVQTIFQNVQATRKIWIVHPEYKYDRSDLPAGEEHFFTDDATLSEAEYWQAFVEALDLSSVLASARIAIDITGIMRPHLMLLPLFLRSLNVERVDFVYTDPIAYVKGANTQFTKSPVTRVATIGGLEGSHSSRYDDLDTLIVGAGYDMELVRQVSENKRSAKKFVMLGLPGLQSHMYQESRFRLASAGELLSQQSERSFLFSPADNPFVTAQTLYDHVKRVREEEPKRNIYLSALGPKPQVLGFALYLMSLPDNQGTSALFPYSDSYSRETSIGIARVHVYTAELDWVAP